MTKEHVITFEKLCQVMEMITQPFLYRIIYFKNYYKMIAIDLRKKQALDADPKVILQTNFSANLDRAGQIVMHFIIEEARKTF